MHRHVAPCLVLLACGQRSDVPATGAADITVDPAPGSARSSHRSPPRSDWPCGFTIDEHRGVAARAIALFHYGARTSCRLPMTLVARGIWGCPDSYTRTDPDGRARTFELHYDAAGRVIEHAGEHYTWTGDRLASTDAGTYVDRDSTGMLVDGSGAPLEVYRAFDAPLDRVDHYRDGEIATTVFPWWRDGKLWQLDTSANGPVLHTFECPTDAAPLELAFQRFAEAAVVVRVANPTDRPVYRIQWQTRYEDAAGNLVPFATTLGMTDRDENSWFQTWPIVRAHETKELALPVNYAGIPHAAVRAELVITDLADNTWKPWYCRPLDDDSRFDAFNAAPKCGR